MKFLKEPEAAKSVPKKMGNYIPAAIPLSSATESSSTDEEIRKRRRRRRQKYQGSISESPIQEHPTEEQPKSSNNDLDETLENLSIEEINSLTEMVSSEEKPNIFREMKKSSFKKSLESPPVSPRKFKIFDLSEKGKFSSFRDFGVLLKNIPEDTEFLKMGNMNLPNETSWVICSAIKNLPNLKSLR